MKKKGSIALASYEVYIYKFSCLFIKKVKQSVFIQKKEKKLKNEIENLSAKNKLKIGCIQ
jgi:hypothetical protein